jgi:uncharacterized protein YbgA (DUF1722 family)/uncharacterized protein YbbK (DUF523 family)
MLYVRNFPRPRLAVSACLNQKPVRYNAQTVKDEFVLRLLPYCEVIDVCPEVEIGLGVPRDRVIVYLLDDGFGLSQPSTGLELTERIKSFSESFLGSLPEVDGFILKSKSPSCGVSNTSVYKDREGKQFHSKGKGLFAIKVLEKHPMVPVEDEGRLKNPELKEHFLVKIFAIADIRESLGKVRRVKELMDFHQRYKYLLMAHSQVKLKEMGRLVASTKEENLKESLEKYRLLFLQALKRKPSIGQHANTIFHIFGHLSSRLKERERAHFYKLVEGYKGGKVEHRTLIELLKSLAYRFDVDYLLNQAYLEPYPAELI